MVKTFKQFLDELYIRDTSGKIIGIKKQKYRGADMKMHKAYPGKSASSGGGSGGGASGSGDE
jgi:uncharacterized membrane protein